MKGWKMHNRYSICIVNQNSEYILEYDIDGHLRWPISFSALRDFLNNQTKPYGPYTTPQTKLRQMGLGGGG